MTENDTLTEFYKRKKAYNYQILIFSYTLYEGCTLMVSLRLHLYIYYIIPPIPPPIGICGAGLSSLISVITHSVERNIPAMEAAFSNATRVTFAGSITPVSYRFSY